MEIKLQLRQTGKSYDIAQLMLKNPNSICIQPTEVQANYFSQRFNIPRSRVFAINHILLLKSSDDQEKYHLSADNNEMAIYIDEIGHCLQMALLHLRGNIIYGTHTVSQDILGY